MEETLKSQGSREYTATLGCMIKAFQAFVDGYAIY